MRGVLGGFVDPSFRFTHPQSPCCGINHEKRFCQHTSSAGILAVLTALLDGVVDHGDALEGSS